MSGGAIAVSDLPGRRRPGARRRLVPVPAPALSDRFFNRELSWLDFDRRVLELAADASVPLLERVKLCGIVSSNLDEFFAVRVAGLLGQVESGRRRAGRPTAGRRPRRCATCRDARRRSCRRRRTRSGWTSSARARREGIRIVSRRGLRGRASFASLTKRFRREIEPLLTPIAVGAGRAVPVRSVARAEHRRARAGPGHASRASFASTCPTRPAALHRGRPQRHARAARGRRSCTSCRRSWRGEAVERRRVPGHARRRLLDLA